MERILTKDEIAELLSAVRDGDLDTELDSEETPQQKRAVSRIDLVGAGGAGRYRINNFDIILDAFTRNYSLSLSSRLQRSVTIKRGKLDYLEFDPFVQQLGDHNAIGVIKLDPLKSAGLFVFDGSLSFSFLEAMLGGSSDVKPMALSRSLTAIEMNVLRGLMLDACGDMQKAFRPLEELTVTLVNIEASSRMVNIVAPDTDVMAAEFDVTVDKTPGKITLMIPFFSLEPFREKLKDGILAITSLRGDDWKSTLQSDLARLKANVTGQFAEISLSVRDILNFQAGDIIDLGCEPNSPIRLLVENKPKFEGMVGARNGKKAVRVTSRIIPEGVHDGKDRE
ncbi:flagellar motor switch protein FliM [Desulfuromonas sp. AOP6]|uniref:flagellar motor switch protein FliM n=1 Tax=Desulfuromonas sp. AOP6 TaxID=1566351 RepID=UPI001274E5DA|nr:flagellar motor switch protein FliM [Desulfuromonas sp. AOP6]BCA79119.1 flagellar motor switch protein FliM [Desulfuromonas sp. AOP6]